MEKGELLLGGGAKPRSLFVYDGLLAVCENPKLAHRMIMWRRFSRAADLWAPQFSMVQFLRSFVARYDKYFDVVTWQPRELADVLAQRLSELRVPYAQFFSDHFNLLSVEVGMRSDYDAVYDADPEHRFGYGFRGRLVTPTDFEVG